MTGRKFKIPVSPINLSVAKSGRFEITHKFVDHDYLTTPREAFLTGVACRKVVYSPDPKLVHQLCEEGSVWMSDMLCEIRQMEEAIKKLQPKGRVLVGGLGLGIVALMLARKRNVTSVDVVELEQDVIDLCDPKHPRIRVIQGDIYRYANDLESWNYDAAFFDTWRGTNEGTWWDEVMPLRRIIANRFGRVKMRCWAEDMMRSQIIQTMTISNPHWKYAGLPLPMSLNNAIAFLRSVGLPNWEKKYGHLWKQWSAEEKEEVAS
jgi:hypothetical protein